MKPTNKKSEYIVKCENKEQTNDVMHFFDTESPDYPWDHWEYIINEKYLTFDDGGFIEHSIPTKYSHLPIISFEEWQDLPDEETKEFILPEKWFIKIDEENVEELNKYLHKNKNKYVGYTDDWEVKLSEIGFEESTDYFYSESQKEPSHSSYLKREGFTEITFEQFKEHVLGEKAKERKIIGYKLVKEEYECEALSLASKNCITKNWSSKKELDFHINTNFHDNLEKSGVLDLWFSPVYEESTETKIMDYLAEQGIEINEECVSEIIKIVNNK